MFKIKCFFLEDTGKWKNNYRNGVLTSKVPIYRRTDTGEEMTVQDAPAGAMWFADWYDKSFCVPQLEHVLVVKTPGGDWIVDSQSSNCGMPEDRKQEKHHCWIIENAGAVSLPDITVSKNGKTCAAGGGSIVIGSYHGFLRNGFLEEC